MGLLPILREREGEPQLLAKQVNTKTILGRPGKEA